MKKIYPIAFLLVFLACADNPSFKTEIETEYDIENPAVAFNHVDWSFDGDDFVANIQDVSATITNSSDANVKNLVLTASMETGENITIYAQKLWGGGEESCMPIQEYNALIDDSECHDDGNLIICTAGTVEYTNASGDKFIPTRESGFVEIRDCFSDNEEIYGRFSMPIHIQGEDPIEIEGTFYAVHYEYIEN